MFQLQRPDEEREIQRLGHPSEVSQQLTIKLDFFISLTLDLLWIL